MLRIARRCVYKYFGNTKNFVLWLIFVLATIYMLDTFVLTQDRIAAIVNGEQETAQENGDGGQVTGQNSNPEAKLAALLNSQVGGKQQETVAEHGGNIDGEKSPAYKCGLKEECPAGQYAYYMKSGYSRDVSPIVCIDDQYLMTPEKKNGNRGLNAVVLDDKTMKLVDIRTFDTYVDEGALVRYLKMGVEGSNIILVASQDEASASLKDDAHSWMKQYGASQLSQISFRDAYVMIGQRGLTSGAAVERLNPRGDNEFAQPVEMSGCVGFPMGKINQIEVKKAQIEDSSSMKLGDDSPNCGISDGCHADSFPVHLYTGQGNVEGPKVCVSGKYVMAIGLNDGGRGLNVAIVDPKTKEVVRVGHFDTYAEDSSNLEIFLEMMKNGEIIVAVSNDDASKKLSDHAKQLLNHLGSAIIQNLKFRDVWVFVSQKGIQGFTEYEQIETRVDGASWPTPIGKRICVPTKLQGSKIKPDPLANSNTNRRKFCQKYDGYADFCDAYHIDEPLTPAPLSDKALDNHPVFKVPIIIAPGLSHNALRMLLETVLMQPGIRSDQVCVMFDEKFPEPGALAELFGFQAEKLSGSSKYVFQVQKAFEAAWKKYPEAKHVIFLEEELILGPDFLSFIAQCLRVVEEDDTLVGVSAFNANGYDGLSTDPSLAYRVETFPGMAFLLKRSFYDKFIGGKWENCCMQRSWQGWTTDSQTYEMIIPDLSRVYRRPFEGLSSQADYMMELFNRKRATKLDSEAKLVDSELLSYTQYESHIDTLLKSATALDNANYADCVNNKGLGYYIPDSSGKMYVIYYEQSDHTDTVTLSSLCKCFGLFSVQGQQPKGLHKGLLRFTYKNNNMAFVGSSSTYYKHKPDSIQAIPKPT